MVDVRQMSGRYLDDGRRGMMSERCLDDGRRRMITCYGPWSSHQPTARMVPGQGPCPDINILEDEAASTLIGP